jgi:oligopeptide transport system permease protein
MLSFLVKRFGWFLLTIWVVYTLSFVLMRLVPGGPFDREKKIPDVIKRRIEAQFLLNEPIHVQYAADLWNKLQLDFGASYKLEDYSVAEVIAEGFPISMSLGILALFFALTLGLAAGVVSAIRRHGWLDTLFMTTATFGIAVPNFVLASVAILLFVFWLDLFPAAGWGTLRQLVLPAFCLGAPFAAYIARLTRTSMLEVLGQDYIRTAFAKGLRERRVVVRHALRGAILPVVSYLGPATAGILTGSLVLERIFRIPGIGSHFIEAALGRDYTLAMGMVLVYTVLLFVMNTLVDISYAFIDPRVKLK